MNELRARGVGEVLIAVVDGLKGFPEAIGTVFPLTTVQTPDQVRGRLCIIHLIRNSLAFVSWKDRKLIMPDLKAIYRAERASGRQPNSTISRRSGASDTGDRPGVAARLGTRRAAVRLPAGDLQDDLHYQCRRKPASLVPQNHQDPRQLPTDEAALKLLFLAIRNAGVRWRRPVEWTVAVGQFAILFGDRFEPSAR